MAEAETAIQAPAAPTAEAPAKAPETQEPKAKGPKAWSYDPAARSLQVAGKEYKLQISAEDLAQYSEVVKQHSKAWVSTVQAQSSVNGLIAAFEAGKWENYTNAGRRFKLLHAEAAQLEKEVVTSKRALQSAAAEFGKLFQPEGLYAEFADDNPEWVRLVKAVLRGVSKE